MADSFGVRSTLDVGGKSHAICDLGALAAKRPEVARLPFSTKVLLENLVRHEDGVVVTKGDIEAVLAGPPKEKSTTEIAFHPSRVLLQDFTGVPAIVDLAAMRDAMAAMGGDPDRINPLQPVDLVIDHSVQVDHFGSPDALEENAEIEFRRNEERYRFLRWGQKAYRNFRVVPPATGIVHQVNLEYLGQVVMTGAGHGDGGGPALAYPDSLVGTDSHTTMINGLGILGWGVGGIEAEAAMLGQPVSMLIPEVVGFRLDGKLKAGTTATDLVLTVVEILRKKGVVGKFVEFYGPGLADLTLADRATIANMGPEYGATCGFFPVDDETLAYLRATNRPPELVDLVEAYCKRVGLFFTPDSPEPAFSDTVGLDLGTVVPSIAGPKRPQDRIPLTEAKARAAAVVRELAPDRLDVAAPVAQNGDSYELRHGSIVIAAITSCTNTSNPAVMLGAGLLARNAAEKGLTVPPWVKTSLAPGSKVVTDYLRDAGLMPPLESLGFHLVGYGCTTCIGNSGPLAPPIAEAIREHDVVAAAVLSGNRNFEGRVHALTRMNYLASPPLVVAYALAGTTDIDFETDPLGTGGDGQPVYLRDVWPSAQDVADAMRGAVKAEQFATQYGAVFDGDERWQAVSVPEGQLFAWEDDSTYIRRPPFFEDLPAEPTPLAEMTGARCLALLGDTVTTDHISPAGAIPPDGPAARYLNDHGVSREDFNSFGSRRGNHEVMMRGTFGNIRLRNRLVPGVEGGYTLHHPSGEQTSIYDAAMKYAAEGTPLVVLAGTEYGTGSSRDWAAKGTRLLGVRAVVAKSYERIHRSNLIGMGVLPLQFAEGEGADTLGLDGTETFDITGISDGLRPGETLTLRATPAGGGEPRTFAVTARLDTPNEVEYLRHGGILPYVLRNLLAR